MILIEPDAPHGGRGRRAPDRGKGDVPSAAGAEGNQGAGPVDGRGARQIVDGPDVIAVEPVRRDPLAVVEIAAIDGGRRGDLRAGDLRENPEGEVAVGREVVFIGGGVDDDQEGPVQEAARSGPGGGARCRSAGARP